MHGIDHASCCSCFILLQHNEEISNCQPSCIKIRVSFDISPIPTLVCKSKSAGTYRSSKGCGAPKAFFCCEVLCRVSGNHVFFNENKAPTYHAGWHSTNLTNEYSHEPWFTSASLQVRHIQCPLTDYLRPDHISRAFSIFVDDFVLLHWAALSDFNLSNKFNQSQPIMLFQFDAMPAGKP